MIEGEEYFFVDLMWVLTTLGERYKKESLPQGKEKLKRDLSFDIGLTFLLDSRSLVGISQ